MLGGLAQLAVGKVERNLERVKLLNFDPVFSPFLSSDLCLCPRGDEPSQKYLETLRCPPPQYGRSSKCGKLAAKT